MSLAAAPSVEPAPPVPGRPVRRARRLYIDSGQEAVVYLHRQSEVCRSEGFESETRVSVSIGPRAILATLNVVTGPLLGVAEAGLSESAWARLVAEEGAVVEFAHPLPLDSLRHVRAKIHGQRLDAAALSAVVNDIAAGRYSDIYLASFLTACGNERLDRQEMIDLTLAMVASGDRLDWGRSPVMDKHSVAWDRDVEITLPDLAAYAGRRPVLVDDLVSTGGTMAAAVRALRGDRHLQHDRAPDQRDRRAGAARGCRGTAAPRVARPRGDGMR
jgi:thymidine phosphorylase